MPRLTGALGEQRRGENGHGSVFDICNSCRQGGSAISPLRGIGLGFHGIIEQREGNKIVGRLAVKTKQAGDYLNRRPAFP